MNGKSLWYSMSIILLLIALGFFGYYIGFLGTVYNIMMPENLGAFPLVLLSALFGIAAFFSPCAFTVLPGYVSHYLSGGIRQNLNRRQVAWQSLQLGFIGAIGIILVNMVIGIIIALLGAATPFAKDPREDITIILAIRVIAGFAIAGLGILTIMGRGIRLHSLNQWMAERGFAKSIFFYGILYNGAAIGCTGPIMLGLLLYAFANASFAGAFLAFFVFSLVMGMLMIFLTLIAGLFKGAIIQQLAIAVPAIKKIAGIIMIIVGLAIALLTLEGNRIFVRIFFPFLS